MRFDLRKPCKDCPFVVGTSMILQPGRMDGIAESLRDDHQVFPCHKTTHALAPEDMDDEDEDGYAWHGREQACPGALAFTLREFGMLPVLARIAVLRDRLTIDEIRANFEKIHAPGEWETER